MSRVMDKETKRNLTEKLGALDSLLDWVSDMANVQEDVDERGLILVRRMSEDVKNLIRLSKRIRTE